jgi:hypothetical protein
MSACMRSLYSSDQWAPGFSLLVFCGRGTGGVLLSLGDFLTPAFSLSVARDDVGLEDDFELSMQLFCAPRSFVACSRWYAPPDVTVVGYPRRCVFGGALYV